MQTRFRGKTILFIVLLLSMGSLAYGTPPTYRLLVLYTDSVGKAMPNIRDYIISWAINNVNTIYAQSDPGNQPLYQVQLAGIDSVHYKETNPVDDNDSVLVGLFNGIGSFAEVRTLRERYSADVVLLLHNGFHSGCAKIVTSPGYGTRDYCVAVSNYHNTQESFMSAHEIGHLMGAAHQWGNLDPATIRAPLYAHAFLNSYGHSTIMYSYSVGNNTMPYFSNPTILDNGVPMGKTDSAFNTKRLRENVAGIDAWKGTPSSVVVQNATIYGQEFADIRATDVITINAPFTVVQGGQLNLSSGTSNLSKKRSVGDNPKDVAPPTLIPAAVRLVVFKAVNGAINASYALTSHSDVTFMVFNVQGKLVSEKKLGTQIAGRYTEKLLEYSKHSHQVYVVTLRAGNTILRQAVFSK